MARIESRGRGSSRLFRGLSAAVYILIFICMLAFNFLTPYIADDYSQSFSFADGSRLTEWSQLIPSIAAHWANVNGRVLPHLALQIFHLMPKAVFNILNALNAVLLAFIFTRFLSRDARKSFFLLLSQVVLMFCYMPVFGNAFLWMAGAVNYTWGFSLFLLFILPFASFYSDRVFIAGALKTVLFFILSFAVGTYSENGSAACIFMAAVLSLLIYIRDRKIPWQLIAALLLCFAGLCCLAFAPSTASRGASSGLSSMFQNLYDIGSLSRRFIYIPSIIYLVLLVLSFFAHVKKESIILSLVFIAGGLCSLAAFTFALYFHERHLCFTFIFILLASLKLMDGLLDTSFKAAPVVLSACTALLFIFSFTKGAADIFLVNRQYQQRMIMIEEALETEEKNVCLPVYECRTYYSGPSSIVDMDIYPHAWPNLDMENYYGLNGISSYMPDSAD